MIHPDGRADALDDTGRFARFEGEMDAPVVRTAIGALSREHSPRVVMRRMTHYTVLLVNYSTVSSGGFVYAVVGIYAALCLYRGEDAPAAPLGATPVLQNANESGFCFRPREFSAPAPRLRAPSWQSDCARQGVVLWGKRESLWVHPNRSTTRLPGGLALLADPLFLRGFVSNARRVFVHYAAGEARAVFVNPRMPEGSECASMVGYDGRVLVMAWRGKRALWVSGRLPGGGSWTC